MSSETKRHLVVIQHGMWGSPSDTSTLAEQILNQVPNSFVINISQNSVLNTYHGIDVCGTRLFEEVKGCIEKEGRDTFDRISFIGYSAGGLFCRYAIVLCDQNGFFDGITPDSFITVASPHMGIRHSNNDSLGRFWNKGTPATHFYGGRTAYQMALLDSTEGENFRFPLVVEMALPNSPYIATLKKFKQLFFYANAKNDRSVHYCSAAIASFNPYKGEAPPPPNPNYPNIIAITRIDLEAQENQPVPEQSQRRKTSTLATASTVVGAAALSPLLLAHAALVFAPLRFASWLKDPGEVPQNERPQTSRDLSTGPQNEQPSLNDQTTTFDLEKYPQLIRECLCQLPITRVVCRFPEMNSHGEIVARRSWNSNGRQVVDHICSQLGGALAEQSHEKEEEEEGGKEEKDEEEANTQRDEGEKQKKEGETQIVTE